MSTVGKAYFEEQSHEKHFRQRLLKISDSGEEEKNNYTTISSSKSIITKFQFNTKLTIYFNLYYLRIYSLFIIMFIHITLFSRSLFLCLDMRGWFN